MWYATPTNSPLRLIQSSARILFSSHLAPKSLEQVADLVLDGGVGGVVERGGVLVPKGFAVTLAEPAWGLLSGGLRHAEVAGDVRVRLRARAAGKHPMELFEKRAAAGGGIVGGQAVEGSAEQGQGP